MTPWYLFNYTTKKVSSINITIKHLLLEAIGKRFGKKKHYFIFLPDFRSETRDFGNAKALY